MHLLAPDHAHRALPILDAVPFNTLFARAVVLGQAPGQVYVDDVGAPNACYVRHAHGMALLAGDSPDPGFRRALHAYLRDDDGRRERRELLQVHPATWSPWVEAALADAPGSAVAERLNFTFDPSAFERVEAPAGMRLAPVDAASFEAIEGAVVPRDFWRDGAEFERRAQGVVVLEGGRWAAVAFAAFLLGDQLELGVETHPSYRQRGLGVVACGALLASCVAQGLTPLWSCHAGNVASARLATRLGFTLARRHPYYELGMRGSHASGTVAPAS